MYKKPAYSRLLIAGWHGRQGSLTDIYQASQIRWESAVRVFRLGKTNRETGKPCTCEKCKSRSGLKSI